MINLDNIIKKSNAILIDRGDLSRYVPIHNIPIEQLKILKRSKKLKKDTYVATNLLESMIQNESPTRAEANDIFKFIPWCKWISSSCRDSYWKKSNKVCTVCKKMYFSFKKIHQLELLIFFSNVLRNN